MGGCTVSSIDVCLLGANEVLNEISFVPILQCAIREWADLGALPVPWAFPLSSLFWLCLSLIISHGAQIEYEHKYYLFEHINLLVDNLLTTFFKYLKNQIIVFTHPH